MIPNCVVAISKPPITPSTTASIVRSGSASVAANTRGSTSFWTGSAPIERIASICSVTCMAPISAVMPAPDAAAHHQGGQHGAELASQREPHHAPT